VGGNARFLEQRRKQIKAVFFSAPFALDFRIEEQKVMPSAHDKSS
jgi:hypothetical protein